MKIFKIFTAMVLLTLCAPVYGIEIIKDKLSIGNVPEGKIAEVSCKIKNNSTKPIEVGIRPSCDCITVEPQKLKIEPGALQEVTVKVNTKGYGGVFEKEIYIQSSDSEKPYIEAKISGEVIAEKESKQGNTIINRGPKPGENGSTIYIFGTPGCGICKRLEAEILPAYEKKYGITAKVVLLLLDEPENYEKLLSIEKRVNKTLTKIPALYVGGKLYGGQDEILANIDGVFKNFTNSAPIEDVMPLKADTVALTAAQRLKLLPIVFAGAVDSINPCAFATIVFFLSYMSLVLKKTRSEVFLAGLVFIIGVFVTYFLIGVGLFKAVLGITGILKYSKLIYLSIGLFVLFLSGRQFYEAMVLKRTGKMDDDEVKLKLPEWIRGSIEKLITEFTGLKYILPFVLLLAVVITLLELVCTGQVYLPTIIYLTSLPEYRLTAYFYLALYCFLFVAPLILIFVMYYFGLTTLTLKRFFKDNIVTMKLTMAVFFLTMAVFMIIEGVK